MKKPILIICFLVIFSGVMPLWAEAPALANIPVNDFLEIVRKPRGTVGNWAALEGEARHRRSGKSAEKMQVYLGIWFTQQRALAQLIVDNTQGFIIGQDFSATGQGGSVTPMGVYSDSKLDHFGLRPGDMTLSFIYWPFVQEAEGDSVKGLECRDIILQSPEFTGLNEWVRCSVSVDYAYPVKARWYGSLEDAVNGKDHLRLLEVTSFRSEKTADGEELWVVGELKIEGEGWRTIVSFGEAEVGRSSDGTFPEVMRKL